MSDKSTQNTTKSDHSAKVQPQLVRIKREEDEDTWISGEELYTEGSSDEEDCKVPLRLRRTGLGKPERRSRTPSNDRRLDQMATSASAISRDKRDFSEKPKAQKMCDNIQQFQASSSKLTGNTQPTSSGDDNNEDNIAKAMSLYASLGNESNNFDETKISWKAKRGLSENKNDLQNTTQSDSKNANGQIIDDISHIQQLDKIIKKLSDEMKKEFGETVTCQIENRRRLKELLSLAIPESGKLGENTEKFFSMCPEYKLEPFNEEKSRDDDGKFDNSVHGMSERNDGKSRNPDKKINAEIDDGNHSICSSISSLDSLKDIDEDIIQEVIEELKLENFYNQELYS